MAGRRKDEGPDRRTLLRSGVVIGAGLLGGLAGVRWSSRPSPLTGRGPGALPPFLTPTDSFYRYSNGPPPPPLPTADARLLVGPTPAPRAVDWGPLIERADRKVVRTLQCDGNGYIDGGRAPHAGCQVGRPDDDPGRPPPENWDWRYGGIGTAEWDVLSVRELLEATGVPLRGDWLRVEGRDGYLRWFPREVALDPELLVAVGMNGQPLPHGHGAPARLLVPGQYGAMNVKWVRSLTLGDRLEAHPFDGGPEAFYPVKPLAFATLPLDGGTVQGALELAGGAFAGRRAVREVLLWIHPGEPWRAELLDPPRPYVWSRWRSTVQIPPGTWDVTICCVDDLGRYSKPQQPYGDAEGYGGYHILRVTIA